MNNNDFLTAITLKNIPDISECLQQGLDINLEFGTPLRIAIKMGYEDIAEFLLKNGADTNVLQGCCLITAIDSKRIDILELLLEHHADVHANDDFALRWAVGCDADLDLIKLLVNNGADVFTQKSAPLCLAEMQNNTVTADYLRNEMKREKEIFLEMLNSQTDIKSFLRAPYLQTGESALFRAARMECLDSLIDKMKTAGDSFSMSDLFEIKDRHNKALFIIFIAETKNLPKIFRAELWQGRASTLREAWNSIPAKLHQEYHTDKQVDIQSIAAQSTQLYIKQNHKKPTFKK